MPAPPTLTTWTVPYPGRILAGLVCLGWAMSIGLGGHDLPAIAIAIATIALALLGIAIGFWTHGAKIVPGARSLSKWWGPCFPLFWRTRAIGAQDRVVLSEAKRWHHLAGVYFEIVVSLAGVDLMATQSAHRARTFAEHIAKSLKVPLEDRTSIDGTPLLRRASRLDSPIGELAEALDLPDKPAGRSEIEQQGKTLVVRIPPPPPARYAVHLLRAMGGLLGVLLLAPLAVVLAGLAFAVPAGKLGELFFSSDVALGVAIGAMALVTLTVVAVIAAHVLRPMVSSTLASQRIVLDNAGVAVEKRVLGIPFRSRIAADDVEEVLVVRAGRHHEAEHDAHVVARGDEHAVSFGDGLSREELAWLRDATVHYLVGHE